MELIRGLHNLRPQHRGCVVTIGNFDGVHRGHQALIAKTLQYSRKTGLPLTALSFEPTPREFFSPDAAPGRIFTLRDKLVALEQCGVERFIIARFDRRLAAYTADAFIDELLVNRLGIKAVIVGDDFRYGSQRRGEYAGLEKHGQQAGFEVDAVDAVLVDGVRCSSTAIRTALARADLAAARRMLGRSYSIQGRVRPGLQLGRKLGMPTANINLWRPMALKQGIYAVRARCDGQWWDGVASLGVRPTLGMTRCLLETHLFGEPGSLYGRVLEVEFHTYLRSEEKFDSLDALAVQMQRDAEKAKEILAAGV